MKNSKWIIIVVFLTAFMIYNTYKADKKIDERDKRIKELEFQVWSLKLNKRLDSIKEYHVDLFKKRMDSIYHSH